MRIEYTEDEDYPGQFNFYQANCNRSLTGRRGQAALRELEAALLALSAKRLIANELDNGADCCAIGALARRKGLTFDIDPEDGGMEEVGVECGMPRLVAWKVVEANDIDNETYSVRAPGPNVYCWPQYTPGYSLIVEVTPEQRYVSVLEWVRSMLRAA